MDKRGEGGGRREEKEGESGGDERVVLNLNFLDEKILKNLVLKNLIKLIQLQLMYSSSRDLLLLKCQSTIQALQSEIEHLIRKNKELMQNHNEVQEGYRREESLNRREDVFRKMEEVRDLRAKYTRLLAESEQATGKLTEMQRHIKEKEREHAINV